MKLKAIIIASVSAVVIAGAAGTAYLISHRKKTCAGLLEQSVVQMKSEERTELRQIGNDPDEVRKFLIEIHREKLRFWISNYEGSRKRMFDNYNEVIKDPSRTYSLDSAQNAALERFKAIDEVRGFSQSIAVLKEFKTGMTIGEMGEIRSREKLWSEFMNQTKNDGVVIDGEFAARLRSKKPFTY